MTQIRLRIDIVLSASTYQTVQQRTTLSAVMATEKHKIFFPIPTSWRVRSAWLLSNSAR